MIRVLLMAILNTRREWCEMIRTTMPARMLDYRASLRYETMASEYPQGYKGFVRVYSSVYVASYMAKALSRFDKKLYDYVMRMIQRDE
jgi:hypothetical protein